MAQHKTFIPLENNPEVMTKLAHKLGLSSDFAFHDVYSLTDPDLLALVPRPVLALLYIYPVTPSSEKYFKNNILATQNENFKYAGCGPDEPVMFYHQAIEEACGLYGLVHCLTNLPDSSAQIKPQSPLTELVAATTPLQLTERAQFFHDSEVLERLHGEAAATGNSTVPPLGEEPGHAFVAFVRGKDGALWELEGQQWGPLKRGHLQDDEDLLSQRALELGPLPYLRREMEAGQEESNGTGLNEYGGVDGNNRRERFGNPLLRFSCIALGPAQE